MSQENAVQDFDLLEKEFVLCSFNMKMKDTSYIIAVNIIDSYTKTIKISQIIDSNFFSSFESLLKQAIPPHEDINFFLLVNCPDEQVKEKIKFISTGMGTFTKSVIKCNDNKFRRCQGVRFCFEFNGIRCNEIFFIDPSLWSHSKVHVQIGSSLGKKLMNSQQNILS